MKRQAEFTLTENDSRFRGQTGPDVVHWLWCDRQAGSFHVISAQQTRQLCDDGQRPTSATHGKQSARQNTELFFYLFFFASFWHGGDDACLAGQRVSDYVCLQVGATPTTSLPTCPPPPYLPLPSDWGSQNTAIGQWSLLWPSADWMWFHSRAAIAQWNVLLRGRENACELVRWRLRWERLFLEREKNIKTHVENQTPGQSPRLSRFLVYLGPNAGLHRVPHTHSCVSAVDAGRITVVE